MQCREHRRAHFSGRAKRLSAFRKIHHRSCRVLVEHFKRNWLRIALSCAIIVLFALHVSHRLEWDILKRLEAISYDARLLATMPREIDDRIVIVDIDEASLQAQGRWPWSRDKVATLVDQLFERYGVFLVAFDVVFAEPEEASGLKVLDALQGDVVDATLNAKMDAIRKDLDHDRVLATALHGRRTIMGYFFSGRGADGQSALRVGELPAPTFTKEVFSANAMDFKHADGFGANLALLQRSALSAGHFIAEPDVDGLVRRVPMLYEYGGDYYESLALAVARVALGIDKIVPGFPDSSTTSGNYGKAEWLQLGHVRIPVDASMQTLVPYRGRQGSFPYVSATSVIDGSVDEKVLRDRIILIGTTAKGLLDLRATPVATDFPGVEVHANLISGILGPKGGNGRVTSLKENPAYTQGADFLLLVVSGLMMAIALPALSPLLATVATLALASVIVGTNLIIWQWANLVFPMAAGLVMILTLFLFNMVFGYLVEERGKRKLVGQFGQYIPPELVEELSRNPEAMAIGSENKELTVLFTDVRGFTTISESLSPEELSQLMNEYLTPMTEIIFRHRGTIDKYMGDAIMAFWGAPLANEKHARHALDAAFAMLEELRALQQRFVAKGWPAIKVGIGLNTGPMSVGNMGSEFRRAYTVMGDAVNLGSRLEGLTKNYGVEMIVNETTAAAAPEFEYRELDKVRVKGKDHPVTIYEPIGLKEQISEEVVGELKLYRESLKLYREQQWDMAEMQFINLQNSHPDRSLYAEYIQRISVFRGEPPEADWDGVFTHQSK